MKLHLASLLIFQFVFFSSCTSYKSFVAVDDYTNIPKGSKEFTVSANIEQVKGVLAKNTIAFVKNDFGLDTEQIMLDEGTKARYSVYVIDSTTLKIVPYWGYTEKVASEIQVWTGVVTSPNEMKRIIYSYNEARPKKAFDYGIQIFNELGALHFQ